MAWLATCKRAQMAAWRIPNLNHYCRSCTVAVAQNLAKRLDSPPRTYHGIQKFWSGREAKYRLKATEPQWNKRGIIQSIREQTLPIRTTSWYTIYVCCLTAPFNYIVDVFQLSGSVALVQANTGTLLACTGTLTTALFLMLSFRMNKASDRHWEGRGTVGQLLGSVRKFSTSAMAHMTRKDIVVDLSLQAFVVARVTQLHLNRESDEHFWKELGAVLPKANLEEILMAPHRPFFAIQQLSKRLGAVHQAGHITTLGFVSMQESTGRMIDIVTSLDRVEMTPEPWSYQKHMRLIITVWLAAFPGAMIVSLPHAFVVPFCTAVGYIVFKMDSVSGEMQHPFGDDRSDIPLCIATDRLQSQLSWQLQNYACKSDSHSLYEGEMLRAYEVFNGEKKALPDDNIQIHEASAKLQH